MTSLEPTLDALKSQALEALAAAPTEAALHQEKARFLGRRGLLTALMKELASLEPEARRAQGQQLNALKDFLERAVDERLEALHAQQLRAIQATRPDLTLPGRLAPLGHRHPVAQIMEELEDIFTSLGFDIEEGPDVENEWHNFEALNLPENHPARDMQDTFYLPGGLLLRTHTSPVQVRTMLERDPPLRMIAPGSVYRSDYDMTHTPMFHQVEGLMVDTSVSLSDLKGVLLEFVRRLFGPRVDVRFRASFFPFTEPSAEVDMLCFQCFGNGCRLCKETGWIEFGGCGMVNPAVFHQVGRPEYDPGKVQGFAFGMGVERLAMLKFGIPDLRVLFENDVRMLHQL